MAFSDWDSLDTTLPTIEECVHVAKTSDGDKTFAELVEESGITGLPDDQEWTETARTTTSVTLPETACEAYSIVLENVDTITFAMGTKTLKLNLAGW